MGRAWRHGGDLEEDDEPGGLTKAGQITFVPAQSLHGGRGRRSQGARAEARRPAQECAPVRGQWVWREGVAVAVAERLREQVDAGWS